MRKLSTLFLGVLFAGQTFNVCASDIPNASETKQGEIWRHEETSGINELLNPENGVYGIHTYAEDQNAWDSQFYIIFADEPIRSGTPISVHFEYRKDGEGDVSFNACGFADPHVYVNNDGWGTLEATDEWQVYEDEFETSGGYGDTPGIRAFGVYVSLAPHVDGTLLFRNIIITVDGVEAVKTMETDADYAEFSEDNGNGDDSFVPNEWYTYGKKSSPYTTNSIGEAVINVPEAGDGWDVQFCNIFHNVEGQTMDNEFKLSFDVKWEGETGAESVLFYIWPGQNKYYNDEGNTVEVHDDYQIDESNTEILFDEVFGTILQRTYTATSEWTHIEWGGTIGEKGTDYIGIQMNLADVNGNNVGKFYFKNMEVQFGENVLTFFEVAENSNSYTLLYETNGNEATVTGIELLGLDEDETINVNIPSTVTIEGVEYAVTAIGNSALRSHINLKSVTIPTSVKNIGVFTFSECYNLTEIIVEDGNTEYTSEDGVLFNKNKTSLISYPTGKEGDYTIPDGVTTIVDGAFNCCRYLTSLTIPNSVVNICDYTFYNCANMTSVTLPNNLTSINTHMFYGCRRLASITIPETVTSIGADAFVTCYGLTELKIPNSVTFIDIYAFWDCPNLTYNEYDNALYLGNDENQYLCLVKVKSSDITSCEIHENCRIIYSMAFFPLILGNAPLADLTSITIPNSVISIGSYAFDGCSNPELFNEYDNALYLGNSENPYLCLVSQKPEDITSCEINSNCKIICPMAFGSTLETITIPNSVAIIESQAFCQASQGLYCQADSIPAGWRKGWKNDDVLVKWNCKEINVGVDNADYGSATVSGDVVKLNDGSYWSPSGANVTITAKPKADYHFVRWNNDDNHKSFTFAVTQDSSFTAFFEAHTVVTDSAVAATETETGLTEGSHCSVCGETIVAQEVIPALGGQGGNENQGGNNEGGNENQGGNNEGGNNEGGNENQGGNNEGGNNEGGNENNPATAVAESAANAVNIYAHGDKIVVENATDEIRVYNAMGKLVCRDTINRVRATISVNTTGVYIVKTGNVVKRVMVN